MQKLLTIIIPIYEYIDKLDPLIKSIDGSVCNIILNDDGSVINKEKVEEKFKEYNKYPHIKILRSEHLGTWEARKTALPEITTPYFTFADSDDLVFCKNLIYLCKKMKEEDLKFGVGGVLFSLDKIFCGMSRIRMQNHLNFEENTRDLNNLLNTVWSKIYHHSLIPDFSFEQNVEIFDDTIAPYYLAMKSKQGYFTNRPVYFYQMRHNSSFFQLSDNISSKGIYNLAKCSLYRAKAFQEAGTYEKYKCELESIDIRLFLQRYKSVHRDKRIANPEDVSEYILQILSHLVPNWQMNPYYLENFKTCELNDIWNILLANKYLKEKNAIITSENYQTTNSIEEICIKYDERLILKKK